MATDKDENQEKNEKEPYTRPAFFTDLEKVARSLGPDEQHLKKPKGRRRKRSS